ncbi:hypothetical protein HN011_001005 [Eciton burchellii]|nr:hypothetical protein HN011_001005 [Eciton burchellii]
MKFLEVQIALLVFAVFCGIYCSDDLDDDVSDLKTGENYQDIDATCKEYEKHSECSGDPTCQETCENMDQWKTMSCTRTKVCIRGCVCKDGYVRDDYNGVCVRKNSCPRVRH